MRCFRRKYVLIAAVLFIFFVISILIPFPEKLLQPGTIISLQILDRNGKLLREVLSSEEGRARWISYDQVPPCLIDATLAAEDGRFYHHPGVDSLAILRALVQNIRGGKVISGASTITQQLVRNIFHFPRTIPYKILECWYALRLERTILKNEILTQYLNRVPYGNQTFGVEAASQLYFNKSADYLSLAEAAFLAGLPRSPSGYNPFRYPSRAKRRQSDILWQMFKKQIIDLQTCRRALREPLNLTPKNICFRAPHFCDWILKRLSSVEKQNIKIIRTTIDISIQREVEKLLQARVKSLSRANVSNGAVMVMDNQTGEILAMVGSENFFSGQDDGQVNGALSLRQPGSTLKPFTYGLALKNGLTPSSIIPDIPTHVAASGGDFTPENYDGKFHGPVRLRTALACSYNVPAVRVIEKIGSDFLLERLHQAGFESLKENPEYYGLGLTLGNGEVTLLELTRAYRTLANNGLFQEEKSILEIKGAQGKDIPILNKSKPKKIFSPGVSYLLTHILSDQDARIPAFGEGSPLDFPFPCAVKTGTTKDFRDNWTVGYTPRYTVGVWMGNFDGEPMHNVSGISGAAPLFYDITVFLQKGKPKLFFEESKRLKRCLICPSSGKLPGPYCSNWMEEIFLAGTEPHQICNYHRLIELDKRNGLLAKTDCPEDMKEAKIFLVLPPLYQSWADKEGLLMPPRAYSSISGKPAMVATVKKNNSVIQEVMIAFPDNGDIFKIDLSLRQEYQTLRLEVVVPENIERITWIIDDKPFITVRSPFVAWWPLVPGEHKLQVRVEEPNSKSSSSRPIKIIVLS